MNYFANRTELRVVSDTAIGYTQRSVKSALNLRVADMNAFITCF